MVTNEEQLEMFSRTVEEMAPWHMNIRLTEDFNTGQVFASEGEIEDFKKNGGVSLLRMRDSFLRPIDHLYPDGLSGKRFLDCACNAGGYCFWARERDIEQAFGFDVRQHWISQARFIQQHRQVAPTDRIEFAVHDLLDLPKLDLPRFDITIFKGIFDHLPDPITGMKIAADLTSELFILNTFVAWGEQDGYLRIGKESSSHLMSGSHGLNWHPTGPQVLVDILKWMKFEEVKLRFFEQSSFDPNFGVASIFASRKAGLLEPIAGALM